MKIPYELKGIFCLTRCPYSIGTKSMSGEVNINLVGSNACSDCEYRVYQNTKDNVVDCSYYEKHYNRNGANS